MQEKFSQVSAKLNKQKSELDDLSSQLVALQLENASLQISLDEKSRNEAKLHGELDSLHKAVVDDEAQAEDIIFNLQKKFASLKAQLDEKTLNDIALKKRLLTLKSFVTDDDGHDVQEEDIFSQLQVKFTQISDDLTRQKLELDDTSKKVEDLQLVNTNLQTSLDMKSMEVVRIKGELDSLHKAVVDDEVQAEDIIFNLHQKFSSLKAELNEKCASEIALCASKTLAESKLVLFPSTNE
jgi:predicted RNase H-like nuclease (RuvC/YqgF family)